MQDLFYALILIVIVIYNNAPDLRDFREKYNLKALLSKLKKPDPARQNDDEAKWDRVPTKIDMDEVLSVDVVPKTSTADADKKEGK